MSYLNVNVDGHHSTVRRVLNALTAEHGGHWYMDYSDGAACWRVCPITGMVDMKIPFFDALDALIRRTAVDEHS